VKKTILILGGYGNFGKRICESLAKQSGICVLIAGRSVDKATQLCDKLVAENAAAEIKPISLDIFKEGFAL